MAAATSRSSWGSFRLPLRPLGSDWSRARGDAPRASPPAGERRVRVRGARGGHSRRLLRGSRPHRASPRRFPSSRQVSRRVRRPRDRRALARRRRGRGVPRAPLGPRAPGSLREARARRPLHGGRRRTPEYASDPDVRELLARCHDLQRRFVEAHKEMEATRASSRDPARLRDRRRSPGGGTPNNSPAASRWTTRSRKLGDKATVASLTTLAADLRRESNLETELRRQQSARDRGDAACRSGIAPPFDFANFARLRERGIALRAPRATRRGGGPRARRRDGDAPRRTNRAPRTPRGDSRGDGRRTNERRAKESADTPTTSTPRNPARANSRRRSRSVARFETATRSCVNRRRWQRRWRRNATRRSLVGTRWRVKAARRGRIRILGESRRTRRIEIRVGRVRGDVRRRRAREVRRRQGETRRVQDAEEDARRCSARVRHVSADGGDRRRTAASRRRRRRGERTSRGSVRVRRRRRDARGGVQTQRRARRGEGRGAGGTFRASSPRSPRKSTDAKTSYNRR